MLTLLAIAVAVAAVAVGVRWILRRVDSLGRVRRFPLIPIALLLLLAVGLAIPGVRRATEESRLSSAASRLAGFKVKVHCQSLGGAFIDAGAELGYVKYGADGIPERSTLIKHDQCADLSDYLGSSKRQPPQAQVIAVHVLTHESMHMMGITDEAKAECAAMQRDARTARMLGASRTEATKLALRYWMGVYPNMPDDYRTADCRPGGPLDEGLGDGPWQ